MIYHNLTPIPNSSLVSCYLVGDYVLFSLFLAHTSLNLSLFLIFSPPYSSISFVTAIICQSVDYTSPVATSIKKVQRMTKKNIASTAMQSSTCFGYLFRGAHTLAFLPIPLSEILWGMQEILSNSHCTEHTFFTSICKL